MTSPAFKLAAFAAVLAVLFAGGALAGGAIDPEREQDEPMAMKRAAHGRETEAAHGGAKRAAHPVRSSCASASPTTAGGPCATSTSSTPSACTSSSPAAT